MLVPGALLIEHRECWSLGLAQTLEVAFLVRVRLEQLTFFALPDTFTTKLIEGASNVSNRRS
jgi:hypothetical protein